MSSSNAAVPSTTYQVLVFHSITECCSGMYCEPSSLLRKCRVFTSKEEMKDYILQLQVSHTNEKYDKERPLFRTKNFKKTFLQIFDDCWNQGFAVRDNCEEGCGYIILYGDSFEQSSRLLVEEFFIIGKKTRDNKYNIQYSKFKNYDECDCDSDSDSEDEDEDEDEYDSEDDLDTLLEEAFAYEKRKEQEEQEKKINSTKSQPLSQKEIISKIKLLLDQAEECKTKEEKIENFRSQYEFLLTVPHFVKAQNEFREAALSTVRRIMKETEEVVDICQRFIDMYEEK